MLNCEKVLLVNIFLFVVVYDYVMWRHHDVIISKSTHVNMKQISIFENFGGKHFDFIKWAHSKISKILKLNQLMNEWLNFHFFDPSKIAFKQISREFLYVIRPNLHIQCAKYCFRPWCDQADRINLLESNPSICFHTCFQVCTRISACIRIFTCSGLNTGVRWTSSKRLFRSIND